MKRYSINKIRFLFTPEGKDFVEKFYGTEIKNSIKVKDFQIYPVNFITWSDSQLEIEFKVDVYCNGIISYLLKKSYEQVLRDWEDFNHPLL